MNKIKTNNKLEVIIIRLYPCGKKPGIGTYICTNCGSEKKLDDETDTLPPCSKCNNCMFRKL